ncbi:MAG: hypothetical protein B6I20_07955 [Bacteroidetes bacterium 4572_117]|nr:MAG: hypothetical protein B6I20_07955 [Bacteroidetes bacterium 4572_117]
MNYLILIVALFFVVLYLYFLYSFWFGQQFYKEPKLRGTLRRNRAIIDDVKRTYSYFYPNKISSEANILFVLHGYHDTGKKIRKRLAYGFDKIAENENLVVVYPDGYKKSWNDCRKHAKYPAKLKKINDIKFLKEIENEISKYYKIRIKSIFLFGFSNGGQLANKICMETPNWIKGAAIVAANLPDKDSLDCKEKHIPVPIVLFNGTNDKTNPFKGGLVNVLNIKKLGFVKSAEETIAYWINLANIKNEFEKINIEPKNSKNNKTKIEKRVWKKDNKNYIVHYIVYCGGHTIPHKNLSSPRILGLTNHDINTTDEVWRFFKQV